jgi:DNA-binding HxlR family transcriptional regulator
MERPPRDEYVLTPAGQDFLLVLIMLGAWVRKHRGGGDMSGYVDEGLARISCRLLSI